MTAKMNDFFLKIANEGIRSSIEANPGENFACSPLSVAILLNMFANGCSGKVQEEFLRVLGSNGIEDLKEASKMLITVGSEKGLTKKGGPELVLANGAWFDQSCGVHPCFEKILRSVFETEPLAVDFQSQGEKAVDQVNTWVNENTNGMIQKILNANEATKKTSLILANALFFQGTWLTPFSKDKTKDGDFQLLNGDNVRVPFVNKSYVYFSYLHVKDAKPSFKILRMSYRMAYRFYDSDSDDDGDADPVKRAFSMYFFLPDEKDGLKGLIDHISSNPGFLNTDFETESEKIKTVSIPKFKFSSSLDLSTTMETLGFTLPSLQNMDLVKNLPKEHHEPTMVHACNIELDEEGTRAAAVSALRFIGASLYVPPPIEFVADHPFLFMIRENESGIPFFVGAVLNPESKG